MLVFGLLAMTAAASGWFGIRMLVAAQDISLLEKPLPPPTMLFDEKGRQAATVSLNEIDPIARGNIPQHLIDAIVAVEDRRFYEHQGMDLWAIGRALARNVVSGRTVQGGSTITQQLAKNVFLTHERTWRRKWNEVLLAKKIEERFGKDEIVTMYLNQIYFGEGAWGIKRAADVYFGKPVGRLTVAESALLAGLVKAPSVLSPYKRPEQALDRRDVVLGLMVDQGLLERRDYEEALREPLSLRESKPNRAEAIRYPYFVDQVIREAVDIYGLTENDVLHGGLRIYTTLSPEMQEAAERIWADDELFPPGMGEEVVQAAAVLVNPRDGTVKALVGGRGDQPFRGFNRAVRLERQPGSTMKPIAVYTPALELGYSPDSQIVDEPVRFGSYEPKNADNAFHGEVSLEEALMKSYNIPAVKLLNEIGIERGIDAASRFGIPLEAEEDRTLGLALGGTRTGVSPLQMAEAYGAFANDGVRHSAHTIVRIESAYGTVLAARQPNEGIRATTSEAARTMTEMLMRVVEDGTGKSAAIDGREVAGKTGTTEMPGTGGEGASDNWFVGYTPGLVGAVWLGYDQPDADHYLTTTSRAAAIVFRKVMGQALEGEPAEKFPDADKRDRSRDDKDDDERKREKAKDQEVKKREEEKMREEKKREEKKREEKKQREEKQREREERKREEKKRKKDRDNDEEEREESDDNRDE